MWTNSVASGMVDTVGDTTVTVGESDTLLDGFLSDEERRLMRENLLPCLPSILFMLKRQNRGRGEITGRTTA